MASSKIRIKVGQIEIDYEGDHDFVKADLLALLKEIVTVAGSAPVPLTPHTPASSVPPSNHSIVGTVNAIAAKLAVTSGNELIIAAAAKLYFVDKKETFSRQEVLDAIKSAPTYYKASYGKNLTRYLGLIQDAQKITEVATDRFALTATEVTALGAALAK